VNTLPTFRVFIVALAVALPAFTAVSRLEAGQAPDMIQIESVSTVDRLGNAKMSLVFKLSAAQWTQWKQMYGDRPDVLRRDLRQQFARYVVEDFDLKRNDLERTATVSLSGRGLAAVRGDGTREIEISRNARQLTGAGREWLFQEQQQESAFSPILSETMKLVLPLGATNARLEQPGTDFARLVYQLPGAGGGRSALLVSGCVLLLAGVGLIVVGRRRPAQSQALLR